MLHKSTVKVPLSFFRLCKVSPDAQAVKQQAQICMPRESKQLVKVNVRIFSDTWQNSVYALSIANICVWHMGR